jgi:hypothetical protein
MIARPGKYAPAKGSAQLWDAMRADPEFQEMLESEQTNKSMEKIDSTYMRPTDFSPLK